MKQIKRWGPLSLILILAIASYITGWYEQLNLQAIQEHKNTLQKTVAENPSLSILVYSLSYIGAVALSLPIATLLTLLGGFLFGKWLGTFIVVTSATIGATLIFLIAQSALGQTLREKAGPLYRKVENNMQDNATNYLLFLRLVPLFPFFLVNIVPALFNIPLRTFVLTTFFGIIPGSFVYVNLGEVLGEIKQLDDLISPQTLLAFGLLGLFALLPSLYKQVKARRKKETAS